MHPKSRIKCGSTLQICSTFRFRNFLETKLCALFRFSAVHRENCSVIQTEKATLLVDAGLTGKAVCGRWLPRASIPPLLTAFLLHDHIDHTRAVGILSRKYDMPVYANAGTWEAMNPIVKQVDFRNVRVFRTDEDFYIGDINILPFKTPHDAKGVRRLHIHHQPWKQACVHDRYRLRSRIHAESGCGSTACFH